MNLECEACGAKLIPLLTSLVCPNCCDKDTTPVIEFQFDLSDVED